MSGTSVGLVTKNFVTLFLPPLKNFRKNQTNLCTVQKHVVILANWNSLKVSFMPLCKCLVVLFPDFQSQQVCI